MIATLKSRVNFETFTRRCVFESLKGEQSAFDIWNSRARDLGAHDKGELFEKLCKAVLLRDHEQVWRLQELPDGLREKLALSKADFGIDLVAQTGNGFTAVQAKYRASRLNWRELSTFESLVHRTGPWHAHLVMTTAPSIRRMGRRNEQDKSFCIGKFRSLPQSFWLDIAQLQGQSLADEAPSSNRPDREELARLRLAHFTSEQPSH